MVAVAVKEALDERVFSDNLCMLTIHGPKLGVPANVMLQLGELLMHGDWPAEGVPEPILHPCICFDAP